MMTTVTRLKKIKMQLINLWTNQGLIFLLMRFGAFNQDYIDEEQSRDEMKNSCAIYTDVQLATEDISEKCRSRGQPKC